MIEKLSNYEQAKILIKSGLIIKSAKSISNVIGISYIDAAAIMMQIEDEQPRVEVNSE